MSKHANSAALARTAARELYNYVREVRTYLRALASSSSDPGTRVLIFAQGRTGTTLLESLLCSTGLFRVNDEPLMGKRALMPSLYLRGLARDPARQGPGGNFICHVKVYHLNDAYKRRPVDPATFLRSLVRDGWRVIHVRREDPIRQILSLYVAKERGNYHKRDERDENTSVTIDREDFEKRIPLWSRRTAEEQAALSGIDYHEVIYERDLLDPTVHERTVDGVLSYVGLERDRPVATSLRKINNRPISEIIENYSEFAGWVRDLGFGASLDGSTERP